VTHVVDHDDSAGQVVHARLATEANRVYELATAIQLKFDAGATIYDIPNLLEQLRSHYTYLIWAVSDVRSDMDSTDLYYWNRLQSAIEPWNS
jgi:hypothetical protein